MLYCVIYCFFTIFTWWVQGMPMSSTWKDSPALYYSQYSNYSNSNTSWTPGEPSKVRLGISMTTSTIKIGEVKIFFFWPLARPPPPSNPWFRILVPPPPCHWWTFPLNTEPKIRLRCHPSHLGVWVTSCISSWKPRGMMPSGCTRIWTHSLVFHQM